MPKIHTETRYGLLQYLSNDNAIGTALKELGEFSESDNILMRQHVNEGDVCFDIGSHIGLMALAMSEAVGKTGLVVAFEPQKPLFECLISNFSNNAKSPISLNNFAVGERCENLQFPDVNYEELANFGAFGLYSDSKTSHDVRCINLDSLHGLSPQYLKIDVEGHERNVLEGARKTILRSQPFILFEANERDNLKGACDLLLDFEYDLFWHASPFWRKNNFKSLKDNIFPSVKNPINIRADLSIFGCPKDKSPVTKMYPVTSIDEDIASIFNNTPLLTHE